MKLIAKGHINIHKTQTPSNLQHQPGPVRPPSSHTANRAAVIGGPGPWRKTRMAPYTRIDHRRRINNPHRHRTLVLNNPTDTEPSIRANDQPPAVPAAQTGIPERVPAIQTVPASASWISKCDRHMQLISSTVYDKDTETRNKAIRETRRQKAFEKQQIEKAKIHRHLESLNHRQASNVPFATPATHTVYIDGLRFAVMNGGSKLLRIRGKIYDIITFTPTTLPYLDASNSAHSTPRQANIGGVSFYRSKNGNMYRSGIVEAKA